MSIMIFPNALVNTESFPKHLLNIVHTEKRKSVSERCRFRDSDYVFHLYSISIKAKATVFLHKVHGQGTITQETAIVDEINTNGFLLM